MSAFGLPAPVAAGAAYCLASGSMIMMNKAVLSSFDVDAPTTMLLFQTVSSFVLVVACHFLGVVQLQAFNTDIVRIWLPVNVLFVGMILSGFWSLKYLGVGIVSVLKNLTNFITITADIKLYGRKYSSGVWVSLGLIFLSAICGASTDRAFSFPGYMWQLVNCILTASYSLYLKQVMEKIPEVNGGKKLDEFGMVFYNNMLASPLIAVLAMSQGEWPRVFSAPDLGDPRFQVALLLTGIIGFAISFASLWFLSTTSPGTMGLVGSLNKIPVSILSLFVFKTPTNIKNITSILIGLLAGVAFAKAKDLDRSRPSLPK